MQNIRLLVNLCCCLLMVGRTLNEDCVTCTTLNEFKSCFRCSRKETGNLKVIVYQESILKFLLPRERQASDIQTT